MILKVFSVFDTKAELYRSPFYMNTVGEALRAFQDLANDPSSQVNKHPGDFQLVLIAEYDDATGTFVGVFKELGFAKDFLNAKVLAPIKAVESKHG